MKTLLVTLAATATLGLALSTTANAEAGHVRVNVRLGVPAVVHHPRVAHRPATLHHRHVYYRPVRYHRHHHRHGHHRLGHFHRHRPHAPAFHYRGFEQPRVIEEINIDPRLQRR